ncbi:hypothetical protein, partial [Bacillus mycoides]|uniref:hypothetical protein n=1 Tax=Bacillus mycoides TaxID=1405 RepID=UPI0011A215ED
MGSVGELLEKELGMGVCGMEGVVGERMWIEDRNGIRGEGLIKIGGVIGCIKELLGSCELCEFMEERNRLGELTDKRRLSALGASGLT